MGPEERGWNLHNADSTLVGFARDSFFIGKEKLRYKFFENRVSHRDTILSCLVYSKVV